MFTTIFVIRDEKISKIVLYIHYIIVFFATVLTNFNFYVKIRAMENNTKKHSKNNPLYETFADDPFYLFLRKETYLLDVPHYHESIELVYMIKGKARAHVGGSSYDLNEGDIFIGNSQQVHFYENFTAKKLAFCVVLSNKYTHDFRQVHKNCTFPPFLGDKEKNAKIYTLLQQWFDFEEKTFLSDCAFANLLLDTLIKLYGFADPTAFNTINAAAIQLINYVTEHYAEPLSLERVAKHFGYSKEYFSKFFKQAVGVNFLSFLNTTRTQMAMELCNNPNVKLSAQEICTECGFNNTTSLYRHLKKAKAAKGSSNESL